MQCSALTYFVDYLGKDYHRDSSSFENHTIVYVARFYLFLFFKLNEIYNLEELCLRNINRRLTFEFTNHTDHSEIIAKSLQCTHIVFVVNKQFLTIETKGNGI